MHTVTATPDARHAKVIEVFKRVRWDIGRDRIRGRHVDDGRTVLPGSLSRVHEIAFLSAEDKRLPGHRQGRIRASLIAAEWLRLGQDGTHGAARPRPRRLCA